jgi:hypothetical protein
VVGILLVMLTLFYFSSLVIYGMVVEHFRDVFTGIGAEVTEQVEFVFQKLGDRTTKNSMQYKTVSF